MSTTYLKPISLCSKVVHMNRTINKIKELQELRGKSNREMAEEIGISRVMYSYLRRGVWIPGVSTLKKMVKVYPGILPYVTEDLMND